MGERLLCKQEVVGSIPITSTTEATQLPRVRQRLREQPREHPTERCGASFMSSRDSGCASNRESGRARQAMTDGRLIDREKQFAHGCELVGV